MTKEPGEDCDEQAGSNQPVVLHAKLGEVNGTAKWGLGFNPDPPPRFIVGVDLAKRAPGKDIVIHLAGSPPGIKFDTTDPIWVCETGDCPPPPGSMSDQVKDIECTDRKLTFHDTNSRECILTYQLNFVGAEPLDPMIRNGGF